MIGRQALIHRTYRHKKMMRDKKHNDKGPTSFDSFEKDLSPGLDGTTRVETR